MAHFENTLTFAFLATIYDTMDIRRIITGSCGVGDIMNNQRRLKALIRPPRELPVMRLYRHAA